MDFFLFTPFFPLTAFAKQRDIPHMILSILIYVLGGSLLAGIIWWLCVPLYWIGIIRTVRKLIIFLIRLYCGAGVIMSVLRYVGLG